MTRPVILDRMVGVALSGGGDVDPATTDMTVNTTHHQAIETLGDSLEVEGTAPDGIVDAVRSAAPEWSCVGVQWHPERNDDRDGALLSAFTAAAS
jgi:gamma-glutamyl-gamma-aminobutyrate hydrolase PuuD